MAQGGGRSYTRSGGRQSHSRGRGSGRGRGRGRGGSFSTRSATQSLPRRGFKTSRLQEPEDLSEEGTELGERTQSEDDQEEDDNEDPVSSASEGEDSALTHSYTTLLEVLKPSSLPDTRPTKRRKVETGSKFNGRIMKDVSNESGSNAAASTNEDVEVADHVLIENMETEDEDGAQSPNATDEEEDSETEGPISQDPFEQHFAFMDVKDLKAAVSAMAKKRVKSTLLEEHLRKQSTFYEEAFQTPQATSHINTSYLKSRLNTGGLKILDTLSEEQKDLATEVFGYRDIHFGHRTLANITQLRDIVCLHSLNHIFKTRDRVLKNNAKLSQQETSESLDLRDQGFTRPKVLVIVPTKQACIRFVESIVKISEPDQQENKTRLWETFSQEDDDTWDNKPEDFRELFGGNHEEDFRVGLKFTRKTIKYFSGFYNSDIIFGSALGLMRTITTGGGGAKDKKKGHDADFLSSIEVIIVDHGTAIQMQNFQHLEYVFSQLNQLPKESHGCDFARVRHWYLDGDAKYLRQTILLSSYHTPELNSLFSNHTFNISGIAKYTPTYTGSMLHLPTTVSNLHIPQTFLRFDSSALIKDGDARFKFFTTTTLPQLLRHRSKGILIFVPTYLDFVRLRNHFYTTLDSVSVGSVSEYTSVKETARARSYFMSGRHSLMIYSERAHHHFRYRIRGVKRVVFYGVPENPVFWAEVLGMLGLNPELGDEVARGGGGGGGAGIVKALFSRWDAVKLERIVGTERVGRLINDRGGDTFEFV